MDVDYYDVLGLPVTASASDIKAAYRKLSLQWHPDKNRAAGAEEKFKLVAEAYDTLSDSGKRATYDRERAAASAGRRQPKYDDVGRRASSAHVSFGFAEELFRRFFGGRDPFAEMRELMEAPPSSFFSPGSLFERSPFFRDPFFGDPFASMRDMLSALPDAPDPTGASSSGGGGFSAPYASFSSSMGSWSGGAMTGGRSVRSVTTIEGGERVTRTTTTVRHADGREETTSDEKREALPPTSSRLLPPQQQQQQSQRRLEAASAAHSPQQQQQPAAAAASPLSYHHSSSSYGSESRRYAETNVAPPPAPDYDYRRPSDPQSGRWSAAVPPPKQQERQHHGSASPFDSSPRRNTQASVAPAGAPDYDYRRPSDTQSGRWRSAEPPQQAAAAPDSRNFSSTTYGRAPAPSPVLPSSRYASDAPTQASATSGGNRWQQQAQLPQADAASTRRPSEVSYSGHGSRSLRGVTGANNPAAPARTGPAAVGTAYEGAGAAASVATPPHHHPRRPVAAGESQYGVKGGYSI